MSCPALPGKTIITDSKRNTISLSFSLLDIFVLHINIFFFHVLYSADALSIIVNRVCALPRNKKLNQKNCDIVDDK